MKPKVKFILAFVLIPMILPVVSLLVGIYYKIMPAVAILLLGTVVYAIVVLTYGRKMVIQSIRRIG